MFDSSPVAPRRSVDQAAAPYGSRGPASSASTTPPADDRTFDILALWDDEVSALKEQVDIVSSWGPSELFECIPLFEGADGRRRVLCRFTYHGATSSRLTPDSTAQFKYALLNCLRQITQWEDVAGQNHVSADGE